MPKIGMLDAWHQSNSPAGSWGEFSRCTEFGPPDRMMALGSTFLMSSCTAAGQGPHLVMDLSLVLSKARLPTRVRSPGSSIERMSRSLTRLAIS